MPDRLAEPLPLTYVLPLRHDRLDDISELAGYVRSLAPLVELLVVDGSPPEVFAAHREAFGDGLVHFPPDPRWSFGNGKVDGVMTGLERARHERLVMADEDVRWEEPELRRMCELLAAHDLVRPQNYFDPLPWHTRWDTARTLLNRAFGADYPGTMGVRRSVLLATGGYDGDAMFENLELLRTVRVAGGTTASPLDLYVRRLPPTTRQFFTQRVRQAYDGFAQPVRFVLELAVLPMSAGALARRRAGVLGAAALATAAAAERGRRRAGGAAVFPASCSLLAPLWLVERAVCSWLAVGSRLLWGGIRYRGRVLPLAASSTRRVRRRLAAAGTPPAKHTGAGTLEVAATEGEPGWPTSVSSTRRPTAAATARTAPDVAVVSRRPLRRPTRSSAASKP